MSTEFKRGLVSVIVNCFNAEKYVETAVNSILSQTYKKVEIIIWDNVSSDRTSEIILSFEEPKIRYFRAQRHTNLYKARNLAVKQCSGEFIAFLDSDDQWHPDKLEKQIALFSNPCVGLVYSNYSLSDERDAQEGAELKLAHPKKLPRGNVFENLLKSYDVGLLTIVLRSNVIKDNAPVFDGRYSIIGDMAFVIDLAREYEFDVLQTSTATYRLHAKNESSTSGLLEFYELIKWHDEKLKENTYSRSHSFLELRNKIYYLGSKLAFYNNNWIVFVSCILKVGVHKFLLRLLLNLLSAIQNQLVERR